MYADVPLWLSIVMILGGLAALAWSSGLFVDGAAQVAKMLGISPFVVGMVVIGFGTSAPNSLNPILHAELVKSAEIIPNHAGKSTGKSETTKHLTSGGVYWCD